MLDLSQNSFIESEYESKFNETNPYRQYKEIYKTLSDEEKREEDHYYKWFDGTGIRGWWD